ncbi:MAG: NAD(P) transhydrogenase subunit alpha [Deltaproteobacteria bacterium]|nr:NAD(P) transhydrogenase subunit alpha [Deltaproteobacteria bacterium]
MRILGVLKESARDDRVAIIPGLECLSCFRTLVESGAGGRAGFDDAAYRRAGAEVVSRAEVLARADVIACVRRPRDVEKLRAGQLLVGMLDPLGDPEAMLALAQRGVRAAALELLPRTTRAQAMDVLTSLATVSGYKAAILAASLLPRFFPLLMTAAGTVPPARVLVIGAGVAGLSALATARRLGAVCVGYDVRAAARDQIISVGARPLDLGVEVSADGRDGYASALSQETLGAQQRALDEHVRRSDVLITTASVPGSRAPVLVARSSILGMKPGSVVVDLAGERGGNTEVSRLDETVTCGGVTVLSPSDLSRTVPFHASQLYSRNLANFLSTLGPELHFERSDPIASAVLVTEGGAVVHPEVSRRIERKAG